MKLSQSTKFWLIFLLILVAAFLGGILGNWVFIYLLDKYYGIPGGNYLAAPTSSPIIVRESKTIAERDNQIAQAIAAADVSLIRIFKKTSAENEVYDPTEAILTAFVVTSDGWLVAPGKLAIGKNGTFSEYEAVSVDRKRFAIEKNLFDPVLGISFFHLNRAQNLVVRNFAFKRELAVGQTLIGVSANGAIEIGRLIRLAAATNLNDQPMITLAVNGLTMRPAYLFDATGQMIGLNQGKAFLAMDAIEKTLERVLTDGKISYPRLGVEYLKYSELLAHGTETGALLTALDRNSPAEKGGLLVGDIITAVDDTTINDFNDLTYVIQDYNPGETIDVTIRRNQETKKLSITLDEFINE